MQPGVFILFASTVEGSWCGSPAITSASTSTQYKLAYLILDGPEYKDKFPDIIHDHYNVAEFTTIHTNGT